MKLDLASRAELLVSPTSLPSSLGIAFKRPAQCAGIDGRTDIAAGFVVIGLISRPVELAQIPECRPPLVEFSHAESPNVFRRQHVPT